MSVRRHMARLGREPALGDVSELKFASRPAANAAVDRSSWVRILLSILAAVAFAGIVIAMLDRSAGTAGRTRVPLPVSVPAPSSAPVVQNSPQPAVPSVPTSSDVPPAQDWRRPDRLVYQCVSTSGTKAYQSQPCGADEREANVYAAAPETNREVELRMLRQRLEAAERLAEMATSRAASTTYSSGGDQRANQRAACNAAKAQRESTLRTVGLRRTFDLLRRLDDVVYEACKGLTP